MKNLYLILTVLIFGGLQAQIINIPDANFKAKLLQPNVAYNNLSQPIIIDANGNGEIEVSEIQNVYMLNVSESNISDLTGISSFVNLRNLYCDNNQLTTLEVGNGIVLRGLGASHNNLTSVMVNFAQDYVDGIDLSYNNLTSFAIENLTLGDPFNMSHNQLTSLSVHNCIFYESFLINSNNLTTIDIQLPIIVSALFDITNNQFSDLDFTGVEIGGELSTLKLGNNLVDKVPTGAFYPGNILYTSDNTSFDLGDYRTSITCNNASSNVGKVTLENCPNLQFVTFKNGYDHTQDTCNEGGNIFNIAALDLQISGCPNLSYICTDEIEQPFIQARINALGLQNQVQVNNYCSFTPGGTFYTIQGNAKFDVTNNGCDALDISYPNLKFQIADGTTIGTTTADSFGNYNIGVQAGTHTITPQFENPSYFNVLPTSASVTVPLTSSPFGQDFCVTANGVHNDVEITVLPITGAAPGFNAKYKISYRNKGTQATNGNISFGFDDSTMDLISSTPLNSGTATNSLTYDFSDLNPFETRTIVIVFNINNPMESPAVNGGDVLNFNATINIASDEMTEDNTFILNQTVVNSLDPNDKICLEGNNISPDQVGKYLHYLIRFENSGTAPAQNIVVKDMIDLDKFDISSLIAMEGSHNYYTRIKDNKVEFIFENIYLPFDDGNNDGYVMFKIKTKSGLLVGDSVSNSADIYFDYNFPINTDPAVTTVAALKNIEFASANNFTIYPNPVNDILNIKTDSEIKSIEIYNILGQRVLVVINAEKTKSIDVSNLKSGSYFIKVKSANGNQVAKFIKK